MKDKWKIVLYVIFMIIWLIGMWGYETGSTNIATYILSLILSCGLTLIGGYLIFRIFKPYTPENERTRKNKEYIKAEWRENRSWTHDEDEIGEPDLDYIYEKATEIERNRIYTRFGFFIIGILFLIPGVFLLIGLIKSGTIQ